MLYPKLESYVTERLAELEQIPPVRRQRLEDLSRFVQQQLAAGAGPQLLFVCTHNSRRSHMAQIWAQAAAHHFGVPEVKTYSGGMEATAFHPNAVRALEECGFHLEKLSGGANPLYHVQFSPDEAPLRVFSKSIPDPENPASGFGAVMTCGQADEACPFVPGASTRIVITYEDPKAFDHTPEQASRYADRCRQIAREMLYAFRSVKAAGRRQRRHDRCKGLSQGGSFP